MELENVVPWGRSFSEYQDMFLLSESDLASTIISVADGPSSFNVECAQKNIDITSVDPVYQFSADEIAQRIDEVYPIVMQQVESHVDNYIWESLKNPQELAKIRLAAMQQFLDDYRTNQQRYIKASLPKLPFTEQQFDLALCSHFLFLYSKHFDLPFHVDAISELCRIAKQVRIYPLVTLEGQPSPYIQKIMALFDAKLVAVNYQFQKNATHMLVISGKLDN